MNPFRISEKEALFGTGEVSYLHNEKNNASCAFEIFENSKILIKLPRAVGASRVRIDIRSDGTELTVFSAFASFSDIDGDREIYTVDIDLNKLGVGLYFYTITLNSAVGTLYSDKKEGNSFSFSLKAGSPFQLSISDFKYDSHKEFYGGIIYHLFVDRFRKKGSIPPKDGTYYVENWESDIPEYPEYPGAFLKNNYFYGGNLLGVKEKLPYLAELGVTLIYLSPIFESPSNHKYDTSDYLTVDSMFGGEEALRELISEAHKYGIGIILDGVFNHTGADSIYFNKFSKYSKVGAYQSKESEYYDWFEFKSFPNEYTCWWGIEILPRINPDNTSCCEYFVGKQGVIEKYRNLGVCGFRLDVCDELSDSFIEKIKRRLCDKSEPAILFGEVWEDASNKIAYGKRKSYYLGSELDGVMNYPLREGIIAYLKKEDTSSLRYALSDIINNAPAKIRNSQMNLIGTHDTERIITVLGGESSKGKTNSYLASKKMTREEYSLGKRRLLSAYTVIATLPGIPSIFYGDEAGLEGYSDPFNRKPFPWNKIDRDINSHYKKIGKIRRENNVYKDGEFFLLCLTEKVLIFKRVGDTHDFITVLNNTDYKISFVFSEITKNLIDDEEGNEFILDSEEAKIFKVNKNTNLYF